MLHVHRLDWTYNIFYVHMLCVTQAWWSRTRRTIFSTKFQFIFLSIYLFWSIYFFDPSLCLPNNEGFLLPGLVLIWFRNYDSIGEVESNLCLLFLPSVGGISQSSVLSFFFISIHESCFGFLPDWFRFPFGFAFLFLRWFVFGFFPSYLIIIRSVFVIPFSPSPTIIF